MRRRPRSLAEGIVVLFNVVFSLFAMTALRIWRPGRTARALADRCGWTVFALWVYAMSFVAMYAIASEGEGWGVRSRETIRLQTTMLFTCAAVAISGPLIAFLRHAAMKRPEQRLLND